MTRCSAGQVCRPRPFSQTLLSYIILTLAPLLGNWIIKGCERSKTKRNCSEGPGASPGHGVRGGLAGKRAGPRAALTSRPPSVPTTCLWHCPLANDAGLAYRPQDQRSRAETAAAKPPPAGPLPDFLARSHPKSCRGPRNRRIGQAQRLGQFDGFVARGMIWDAIEPKNLVKAQPEEVLQQRFLRATFGLAGDKPIQRHLPADNAIDKLLAQMAVGK